MKRLKNLVETLLHRGSDYFKFIKDGFTSHINNYCCTGDCKQNRNCPRREKKR